MPDELSQRDIDSMLRGASESAPLEPENRDPEVLRYDFRRPPRVPTDRQGTIEALYGRYAVSLQAMLSSRLRVPTDVVVSGVEQATFAEYVFSLATPCTAFVFALGGEVEAEGVLDFGPEFPFYLVDRLFGGPGEGVSAERPLTALERLVVQGVADRFLLLLGEAWKDQLTFRPKVSSFELAPEALQTMARDDNVLVTNLEVRSGDFSGLLALCLPLSALEKFLTKSVNRHTIRREVDHAHNREQLDSMLRVTSVDVSARFPTFLLPMHNLSALKIGNVIHTGHPLDVDLELTVGDKRRFLGQPGRIRHLLGMRVIDVLSEQHQRTPRRIPRGRLA